MTIERPGRPPGDEPEQRHDGVPDGQVVSVAGDPFPDPGLPAHEPRPTDVDEHAGRRAERQVATLFGLSSVFAILWVVVYFAVDLKGNTATLFGAGAQNLLLGVCLAGALLCIGVGAILWARKLMSDVEIVEHRHAISSSEEDREVALGEFDQGVRDSGIARRPLIRNSLLGAMATLGLPAIVVLRDLGPLPGDVLEFTVWKKGVRVVNDVAGNPIKPADMEIGQLVNAEPELFFETDANGEPLFEGTKLLQAKAKAAVILVRMKPEDIQAPKGRENWGINGILCYSKICTHVGCPISLWEQQTHQLLCPCHQSTFALGDGGKVVFGPANRPLPQLPLMIDKDGYIAARSDFHEPVGPSFWERG
ncbi:MAG TPA: Rieske 2Fe-2S domain-containing protein [Nocardioidaceae bacterium]|nr:Rieske 2Fe-2S domain-containing protein [Nocardioidaceae bacterium]